MEKDNAQPESSVMSQSEHHGAILRLGKKGKKAPFRALPPHERDMLFSYYEKHNGNMLAMTRDMDCPFKAHSQIRYYAKLYFFYERFVEIRRNKAQEVIDSLKDSKVLAIRRAAEMLEVKQIPMVQPTTGQPVLDREGQPIYIEKPPTYKEIEAAWKIIKTELGEATQLSKSDITSKGQPIQSNAIAFVEFNDSESK